MIAPQGLKKKCSTHCQYRNVRRILKGGYPLEKKPTNQRFLNNWWTGHPSLQMDVVALCENPGLEAKDWELCRVMTPKISFLYTNGCICVTPFTPSFALAQNLGHSMKIEVICSPHDLETRLWVEQTLLAMMMPSGWAFDKIEQNQVFIFPSWKDAQTSDLLQ